MRRAQCCQWRAMPVGQAAVNQRCDPAGGADHASGMIAVSAIHMHSALVVWYTAREKQSSRCGACGVCTERFLKSVSSTQSCNTVSQDTTAPDNELLHSQFPRAGRGENQQERLVKPVNMFCTHHTTAHTSVLATVAQLHRTRSRFRLNAAPQKSRQVCLHNFSDERDIWGHHRREQTEARGQEDRNFTHLIQAETRFDPTVSHQQPLLGVFAPCGMLP